MRFEVKAMRDGGAVTRLALDASDEADAARLAKAQGYAVLSVRSLQPLRALGRRRQQFPLGMFAQELLTLLEAGLAVVESLETLREKESHPDRAQVLARIVAGLYEGQPLSQTLAAQPEVFPPLFVATVRASEKTSDLPEALRRYVAYQGQLDVVKKKLVSAAIYPFLLLGVGSLVVAFLLLYVVPRFSRIFEDMGTNIPALAKLLVRWGSFVNEHGVTVLIVGATLIALFVAWLSRKSTHVWLLAQLSKIPAVGERVRVYQLARFYRTVGMLLRGGMPIMTSLAMTSELLQSNLQVRLKLASEGVREGRSISQTMEAHGLTTPVALRMLRVGERTGQMGEMMERIAAFYDEEIARWVDWFAKVFEPVLMLFIGAVIGTVVVMMYFPIFELAGSIQ
jgi:general secretion pathway protein F